MKTTLILALTAAACLLLCLRALAGVIIRAACRWATRRLPGSARVTTLTVSRQEITESYPALRQALIERLPLRPLRWLAGKALDLKAGQVTDSILGFMDRHHTDTIGGPQLHQWAAEWGADRVADIVSGFVSTLCLKLFFILILVAAAAWGLIPE